MHSKFDLENQQSKWLSGTEYYNLLTELTRLIKDGREIDSKIPIFASGEHPEDIYFTPRHSMYALLVKSPALVLFPKLANGFRKQITWKRQNFETNLPKSEPIVTYIGAMGQLKEDVDKCYKMHIVWRCDDLSRDNKKDNMVVLCQIRPFKNSQEPWDMSNKENNDCSLPAPGRELDEYLMKIGEEINRRRKEEALQALAREAQENELKSEEIVKKSSPGQLNMVFKTSDAQNKSMVPGISHKHLQLPQSTVAQTVMKRSETFKFETKPSHTDTQNQQVLGDGLTKRKPEIGLLKVFSRDLSKDMKEGESQSPKSAIPSKEFEEKHTNLRSDWTLPPPKSLKFETTGKGSNRNASLKSITQSVVVKTPQKEENTNKKQTILAFKEDPDEYRQWVLTQAELVRFKRAKTGR